MQGIERFNLLVKTDVGKKKTILMQFSCNFTCNDVTAYKWQVTWGILSHHEHIKLINSRVCFNFFSDMKIEDVREYERDMQEKTNSKVAADI